MKNILRVFFPLLCICLLNACSDKEETGGVRLTDGTKTNQTIYADETSDAGDGIRFTADGPWTAEVLGTPTRSGDASWIRLSRYSGDKAGDYAISVSISANYTGADRVAYIRITCGASALTITVLQKATTEDGELPTEQDRTYDGKPAFAKFDTEKIELPGLPGEPVVINLYTNMIDPVIRVELPGVAEQEEEVATVIELTSPDMEKGGACQLKLDVFPNRSGNERQATLKILNGDETLMASMLLVQVPGVQCQLLNVETGIGSLLFKFKTSEQTRYVRYLLSDKQLSDSELDTNFADSQKSEELPLDKGQTTFDLAFDNLIPATTYYLYLRPLDENWKDVGFGLMEEAATAMQESKHDLVLEVSANPVNDFTVYLPFSSDVLKGTIDWGDGNTENVEGWSQQGVKHVYDVASATYFEVRFSGVLTTLELSADIRVARENTLIAVKQWGYTGLTRINLSHFSSLKSIAADTEGAFRGVENFGVNPYGGSFAGTGIEFIPKGFFDYAVKSTSFDYTFGECKKLTSIPAGLFKNCVNATSFGRTFIECELLEEIPEDLFVNCRKVTSFWATFNGCKSLQSIPEYLFTNNMEVESFEGTFGDCESLTTIPTKLFTSCPKVLYFGKSSLRDETGRGGSGVFGNCKSLQSIPADLFSGNPKVKDMSYAFANCNRLASIPELLFKQNTQVEQMEATFLNCSSLGSIPVTIFDANRKLVFVGYLFSGCSKVKGESPYTVIADKKVHLYERNNYSTEFSSIQYSKACFNSCTELTDYRNLSADWK
ncbi:BACON domain-containing protein [Bacteroides sp.]|uniref:BACON domain-containing protein n=1 Tax=Bacteroides sp. TaxID=29523 RepID=UPI003AB3244C